MTHQINRLKRKIKKYHRRLVNYFVTKRAINAFFKENFYWSYDVKTNVFGGRIVATDGLQSKIIFDLDNLSGKKIDIDYDDSMTPDIRFKYNRMNDTITGSKKRK